jgi:PAS domain S-box-containing protein
MTLRKKNLIISFIISLLMISLIIAASSFILLENLSLLEEDYCIKNVQRAVNVITNENSSLLSTVGDYAAWDETYKFASGLSPDYMISNIIPETLTGLKLNYFIFVDKTGRIFNSYGYDLNKKQQIPISPRLVNYIIWNSLSIDTNDPTGKVGILQLEDGPFLFAVHPILTSKHDGPANGSVIIGRFIGRDYADHLTLATQSSIEIASYTDSVLYQELITAKQISTSNFPTYIKLMDSQSISGYAVLQDIFGYPALIVRTKMERDIYNQGYSSIVLYILLIVLGCLFFIISIIYIIDRQVISRVTELSKSVSHVRMAVKPIDRVPVKGKDEITSLAVEINEMLGSLEEFDAELRKSSNELERRIAERTSELSEVNYILQHEIRERELSEKALIETYNENNQILSSISSIIIGVNKEGIITQWNDVAATMLGFAANEVMGLSFFNLPINWDWERIRNETTECCEKNTKIRMDDIQLCKDDNMTRVLGITLTPLFLKEEEKPGFLLVGADITERRLLEQRVGQSNKMEAIGQMAAGIAHEINTPTQLVGSNLRFIGKQLEDILKLIDKAVALNLQVKSKTATPEMAISLQKAAEAAHLNYFKEEAPKAIADSLEGIDRITHIVSAMRYFSHPGSDVKENGNLNLIIKNALSLSRNEWKHVAEVKTDLAEDLPVIECYPSDLSQVILNLIINSVHAIKDVIKDEPTGKGKISISSRLLDDSVEVRISDSGTGIPEDIRGKIFDPFFTTKDVGMGTGQGLAICFTVIVKKHGGILEFESEIGRGTTFIIRLPRK